MTNKSIYRIVFSNHSNIYEIYATTVTSSDILGFVMVEGILFGEKSGLVIDPAEEKLKTEFEGVKRTLVPLHAIVRIDEVSKRGAAKILESDGSNTGVVNFPSMLGGGKKDRDDKK
ncbi:MAG: DUF1820 family protein [Thiohalomonadales bacterium]